MPRDPGTGCDALTSPFDVELEDESVTQPDVFVLPLDEWRRLIDVVRYFAEVFDEV